MTIAVIEWRRVPLSPYRNYEVSSDGRVRRGGRELKGDTDRDGYRRVLLSYAGLAKHFSVSRLVCMAFHGEPPEGHEVAHRDGDRSNNAKDNLKWATHVENISHKVSHGTHQARANHPRARLTEAAVAEIRASPGVRKALAIKFGVSVYTIDDARSGKNWKLPSDESANSSKPYSRAPAICTGPEWRR